MRESNYRYFGSNNRTGLRRAIARCVGTEIQPIKNPSSILLLLQRDAVPSLAPMGPHCVIDVIFTISSSAVRDILHLFIQGRIEVLILLFIISQNSAARGFQTITEHRN